MRAQELMELAVKLGADARMDGPDRDPEDAWQDAWATLCDRLGKAIPTPYLARLKRVFLVEFTHGDHR